MPPIASSSTNEISEQHDGDGGGSGRVAARVLVEDVHGGHLGAVRQVARDDRDRADLADRAGERHGDAREDAGEDAREHDAAEDGALAGAERAGGLLHLRVQLVQHRLNRAHDERERDEEQDEIDRGAGEGDVDVNG